MSIRAKFVVQKIAQVSWNAETRIVTLGAQYDQTIPEDQRFQKATPSGQLEMTIDNPAAVAQLGLGKAYYLDLTPAE